MGFARYLPLLALAPAVLAGCANHEWVLSRTLAPAMVKTRQDQRLTLFRARVQMGVLEVWARARHAGGDYQADFDLERASIAELCAALASSPLTFREEWRELKLELTTEYGSQWRWLNTFAFTRLRIGEAALREVGAGHAPGQDCARRAELFSVKVGPPDFAPLEWRQAAPAQ